MARRGDGDEQTDAGHGRNDRKRRKSKNDRPDAGGVTEEDLGWLADLRQAREEKADIGPGPDDDTGRRRAATSGGEARTGSTGTAGERPGSTGSAGGRHGSSTTRDDVPDRSSPRRDGVPDRSSPRRVDVPDQSSPRRVDDASERRRAEDLASPRRRDEEPPTRRRRGEEPPAARQRGEEPPTGRQRGGEASVGRRRAEDRPVSSPPVSGAPAVPGPRPGSGEFERVRAPRPEQAPGSRFVSLSGVRRHTGPLPVVQPSEQRPPTVPPRVDPPTTPPRVDPPTTPPRVDPPTTPPRVDRPATAPTPPRANPPAASRATPPAPPATEAPRTGRPTPTMPVAGRAIPPGARILPPPPPGTAAPSPVPPPNVPPPNVPPPTVPASRPRGAADTGAGRAVPAPPRDEDRGPDPLTRPTRSQVRAELRRQLTQTRRLRRLTLAALVLVLLGGLPMVFLIRDAVQDPVFAGLKSLDVPGWAAQSPHSNATGSRLCIRICRYRELQLSSARGTDETDAAYRKALTEAGWDPAPGGRCPQRTDGRYSCWQRDEYVLDLWTRQAPCDQQAPATRPSTAPGGTPAPTGSAAPGGGQGAGDGGCTGSLVTLKVTNRIDPNWHV